MWRITLEPIHVDYFCEACVVGGGQLPATMPLAGFEGHERLVGAVLTGDEFGRFLSGIEANKNLAPSREGFRVWAALCRSAIGEQLKDPVRTVGTLDKDTSFTIDLVFKTGRDRRVSAWRL